MISLQKHSKTELQETIHPEQEKDKTMHFIEKSKEYEKNEVLKEQLEWEYPYKKVCNIPTMTSVSKIKELKMQKNMPDLLTLGDKETKNKKQEKKVPQFLKEEVSLTKAKIGSLVHLCLQKLNEKEEYNLEKIEDLIQGFVQKQLITKKEAEAINRNDILLYTKSELFQDLKKAKQIKKETPFYMDIEAKEMVTQEVEEKILVQGIIDLYYINQEDKMILVDYKTDFVRKEEELIKKYKKQLEIYKRALEESTNKKVNEVYIYSIYLQKEIKLVL